MKIVKPFLFIVSLALISSCSIKNMVYKSAANAMAPLPEDKIKIKIDSNAVSAITALKGEDDIELVKEVFPVILKTYEAMYMENLSHRGLALMTGQLYIMYANAFAERPASYLSDNEFDKKNALLLRACKLYKRGASYALAALEGAYPNFTSAVYSDNDEKIKEALDKCKIHDCEALYWASCGIMASFALDPLDVKTIQGLQGALSMLEKVCTLDSEYEKGAAWEVLTKFYASAPEGMGGGIEKAKIAYKKALSLSQGKNPSLYITYIQAFAIPEQNSSEYDEYIEKALMIDKEEDKNNRLMISLAQEYAAWLKENKEQFILGE